MKTYQITLTDEFAAFVDRVLAEKKWDAADHLMMYALSYVESELENDKHQDTDALRKALLQAAGSIDRGEGRPLDIDELWARAQERFTKRKELAHAAGDAISSS